VAEARTAALTLGAWAESAPAVLAGDFNVRSLSLSGEGFLLAGGHDVDHVFARGLVMASAAEVLERGRLSDHAPVAVTLDAAASQASGPAQAN
jgi:endonuclease/exonuclease/phosphatase (EEP) superfamily protein YafD